MTTSVALMKWTDQGATSFKDTVDRFEAAEKIAGQFGVEIKEIYWTPGGPYDLVSVLEGPDGKNAAAFALTLEALGNLRITWTDAYGPEGMREVISTAG